MMALLKVAPGTSRVHASHLAFERLTQLGISLPVIHHITFPDGSSRDDLVLQSGAPCSAPMQHPGGRGWGAGVHWCCSWRRCCCVAACLTSPSLQPPPALPCCRQHGGRPDGGRLRRRPGDRVRHRGCRLPAHNLLRPAAGAQRVGCAACWVCAREGAREAARRCGGGRGLWRAAALLLAPFSLLSLAPSLSAGLRSLLLL